MAPTTTLTSLVAAIVTASFVTLGVVGQAQAALGTLYAVTGAGIGSNRCTGLPSSLYTLDTSDATPTLIGAVMIGSEQASHITGIAIHPTTGVMYAIQGGHQPDCSDFGQATLLTIDPTTAEATVVGSVGSVQGQYPDIAFDPFGTLYGWNEESPTSDDLFIIDITTGTASIVADSNLGTSQTGLASDSQGRLYLKNGTALGRVDQYTSQGFDFLFLDLSTAHNMLAFDPNDVAYTGARNPSSSEFTLYTVDVETGVSTVVGTNGLFTTSALTFDRGVMTPPDVSDLSVDKTVDIPNPLAGDTITFTLEVTNAGPDGADNVVVKDLLTDGFVYVSQSGTGSYDQNTGEWDVGFVDSSSTVSISITVEVTAVEDYVNSMEIIASDSYDTDSVPGSGNTEADGYDTLTVDVLVPKLFSIDRSDNLLWLVDPDFATIDMAQEVTAGSTQVCGGTALATQPTTGTLFASLTAGDFCTRTLATIDPATGDATLIDDFDGRFVSSLVFGVDQDTLYAATGNNGSDQRTLFSVDPTTAALTPLCTLRDGYGHVLAYHDGTIYHGTQDCSDDCQLVLEVIDTGDLPGSSTDPCTSESVDTGLFREPTALTVESASSPSIVFLVATDTEVWRLNYADLMSTPTSSFRGYLSHVSKGFAINAAEVEAGNVTISKVAAKFREKGNKYIEYTIEVVNEGPDSVDGIVVTDPIPFNTTLVTDFGNCNESGGVLTCNVGTLGPQFSSTFSFQVQVTCKKCSSVTNDVSLEINDDVYDYPFDNETFVTTRVKGKF